MKGLFAALALFGCSLNLPAGVFGPAAKVAGVADWAMGVDLEGDRLAAIAGDSLYALDVADPLAPGVVGSLRGMDNRRQVVLRGGFAYVVSRETGLRIVDARDPKALKLCSRYDSVEFATGIEVVGTTAFLSERINGVEVVDVTDPYRPAHVAIRPTGESQSSRFCNGFLYSGEWGAGEVTVFDARDLADFRKLGTAELGGFGDGLDTDGRYLYCSTGHDARHARARRTAEDVGAGRGLEIFDLADPAKPRHVGRADFPVFKPRDQDFWTVRVADGLAFCCDSHNGLFAVDVRDPAAPKVVDRFCVPQKDRPKWPSGAISSVAVGKGCVYVTSFPGGLWVVPVRGVAPRVRAVGTPPKSPGFRADYPTDGTRFHVYRPAASGQARAVALRGDVAYAAFGDAGLHVLRLDPTGGFAKLGELTGGRRVTDCTFVGDRLVTAEGLDGWGVYELDGPVGFREVARRPTCDRASGRADVAFWCQGVDGRHVALSTRSAPWRLFDVGDIAGSPRADFAGGCQWDRYLADGAVGGRFPQQVPSVGIGWMTLTGESAAFARPVRENPSATQRNGICAFGGGRFLSTVRRD